MRVTCGGLRRGEVAHQEAVEVLLPRDAKPARRVLGEGEVRVRVRVRVRRVMARWRLRGGDEILVRALAGWLRPRPLSARGRRRGGRGSLPR